MFDSLNSSTLRIRRSHHNFHTTKPVKTRLGAGRVRMLRETIELSARPEGCSEAKDSG